MERLRKAVARWLYPEVFAEVKSLRIHHAAHNKTMARDSKHIERLTKESERLDSKRLKAEAPELYASYCKTTKGARVLRLK